MTKTRGMTSPGGQWRDSTFRCDKLQFNFVCTYIYLDMRLIRFLFSLM